MGGFKIIQEYLFIGTENINDESDLCIEGIVPEIEKIDNSDCRIVKYTVSGGDEDSAKLLSAINEIVVDKYKPTVLTNESSAYFNKRLYPLFNEFERKLRKLVYLKSALYNKKDETKAIRHLETMTFNEIFEILFTDRDFMLKLKEKVNDKFYNFTTSRKFRFCLLPIKGKVRSAWSSRFPFCRQIGNLLSSKHLPSKRASALIVLIVLGKLTPEKSSPEAAFLRVPA